MRTNRCHLISNGQNGCWWGLLLAASLLFLSTIATTADQTPAPTEPDQDHIRLQVKVLDHLAGRCIAASVTVTDILNHDINFEGTSKDEQTATNDPLSFIVPRGRTYEIRCQSAGPPAGRMYTAPGSPNRGGRNAQAQGPVVISLADSTLPWHPPQPAYTPPAATHPLKPADAEKLKKELAAYFTASTVQQATWKFPSALEKLLGANEPAVRRAAWEAYQAAPIHQSAQKNFVSNQVTFQQYLSPYTVKTVGNRPAKGWPLFIAMHGGGNGPKSLNDSQWAQMQIYYKDHPEAGGYKYLALRAPNDTWNGFYDVYVYPLIDNLIRQFTLFGDVDVNKVFIMGYSHGGYGAFAIGPKEPDLFAAIHASAGAPTDGETTGKTLRTTVFTVMVGELDTSYGRFDRDQKFRDSIREFRGARTDIYPVTVQFIPNNPHTGLPDRDKIQEMYPVVRNPVPREISWLMTDQVITDFFWLRTDAPEKKAEIDAVCRDNRVSVTTSHATRASILLDSRLVDFKKPVILDCNGQITQHKLQPSLHTLCETLLRRGDPDLASTAELPLPRPAARE